MKDYRLTFPDYVQTVSLTQNDLGNFADITASGKGIGININMGYSSDPASGTFLAYVVQGDYSGTTLTTTLTKTWSFDGKNPTGGTNIHAVLKLKNSGLFSALSFVGDESIKFGIGSAFDKFVARAKTLEQSSTSQTILQTQPQPTSQQTITSQSPSNTQQTSAPTTTNIPKPAPPVSPPIIPQPPPTPTPPITQPTPTPPYTQNIDSNFPLIDEIPCETKEYLTFHIHAHLDIFVDSHYYPVPALIGIEDNTCLYWLHTHNTDGIIHIESPQIQGFTLGQFLDVWKSTGSTQPPSGDPIIYVNGQLVSTPLANTNLNAHDEIVLVYGNPPPPNIPSFYQFPAGL